MRPAFWAAVLLIATVGGCSALGIGNCSADPDLTGSWSLALTPLDGDAGVQSSIPRAATVAAALTQMPSDTALHIGHLIWGTLTASDPGFFAMLTIPQLKNNDGSKTGAELGCTLKINVPIATPVADDNSDQGPLRIALVGKVVARGQMVGDPSSRIVLSEDATQTPLPFGWTGARQ